MRSIAWFILAGAALLLYAIANIIEGAFRDAGPYVSRDWGGAPAIVAATTGGLSGIKCAIAYYVSDALWERGGAMLRWFLAPGNKDLVVAIGITALGAVAISS